MSEPLSSMTGFARVEGVVGALSWVFEARSVNGKGLDVKLRLPSGFDRLDQPLRQAAAARFKRGNVSVSISINRENASGGYRLNRSLVEQILGLGRELEAMGAPPQELGSLLAVRGVIESGDDGAAAGESEDREAALAAILAAADGVFDALLAARREEGARLLTTLTGHLDEIERLSHEAAGTAGARVEGLRSRLRQQLESLLEASPPLSEERLAQELALLATKIDVREELDRLSAHIASARSMLSEGGAIGRRFDFLCQEFNRESNTLCSKSSDVALTNIGLSLKVAVDQLREQVQNIE